MMIPVAGWVAPFGYPRINACSRLPVAFRSVPRPSSPPGAKASTECPSYTRYPDLVPKGEISPCTETILRSQHWFLPMLLKNGHWKYLCFPQHNTIHPDGHFSQSLAQSQRKIHPLGSFIAPLNPRYPTFGAS